MIMKMALFEYIYIYYNEIIDFCSYFDRFTADPGQHGHESNLHRNLRVTFFGDKNIGTCFGISQEYPCKVRA